jgi:hypothetical protein
MITGVPYLFGYKRVAGTLGIDRVNSDAQGTTEMFQRQSTEKLTIIEPFYINAGNQLCFFTYRQSLVPISGPNPVILSYKRQQIPTEDLTTPSNWALTTLYNGGWGSNWEIVKPFYLGGATYFFSYARAPLLGKATVAIDKVASNGVGSNEVWRSDGWANDWKGFEPFYIAANTYMLEYKVPSRTVAIDYMEPNGQGTTEIWRGGLSENFTMLRVFYNGLKPYVLAFMNPPGAWQVYAVRYDDVRGVTYLSSGTWNPGGLLNPWEIIEPFYMNGNIYFFASNYLESLLPGNNSIVQIAQFDPNNNTITTVWSGEWSAGWTAIKPFYVPPTPYPPIVPGSAS